ncbi:MAG TPA: chemotaxis protein CheB [Gemmatimonadales bacterium]|nr:chemotaxis protein CheB [Gemmatimonadales bacterium]
MPSLRPPARSSGPDLIVVGGSAGAVEAVIRLVAALPADLAAAVLVVIHFPESSVSMLPRILNRASAGLPAAHGRDGEPLVTGRIYVARPGTHLLVEGTHLRLLRGPKENGHRPAIDPLFRSAARSRGQRVVGVLLSGTLDDGTTGLEAIRRHGGITVVQDPDDALYGAMPRSALEHVAIDYVLPLADLPAALVQLVGCAGPPRVLEALEDTMPDSVASASGADAPAPDDAAPDPVADTARDEDRSPPSVYTCPECGGTLFTVPDDGEPRFRCRVGHGFSVESLLVQQADTIEAALWSALRALEEHASLSRRMAGRAHERGNRHTASRFTEQAVDAEHHASVIRHALHDGTLRAEVAEAAADATEPTGA